jgi:hypothetical protein
VDTHVLPEVAGGPCGVPTDTALKRLGSGMLQLMYLQRVEAVGGIRTVIALVRFATGMHEPVAPKVA